VVVEAGAPDYSLYLIVAGELDVFEKAATGSDAPMRQLTSGQAFGEVALLTGEPRETTVRSRTDAELLRLPKDDFDELVELSPSLAASVELLATQRLENIDAGASSAAEVQLSARRWHELAMRSLRHSATRGDVSGEKKALGQRAGAAAVGIYLGLFLDGTPESLSIGALIDEHSSFNFALIVALFLSNLPEAMGSSVIMRSIGYGPVRILSLWGGLMLFTGVGAALGQVLFAGASPAVLSVIFAMAAGAMLAMLAETAMPEAYEQGGWVVGITTVLGFLAAYWMKTFE
jgi:CRP-like cAMP-binding protein